MKRFYLVLGALALSVGMLMTAVTPAMAVKPAESSSNGAVKTDLMTHDRAPGDGPFGHLDTPKVGSVILNATAGGRLQMLINVDGVPDLDGWGVSVYILDDQGTMAWQYANGVLDTNAMGQGNARIEFDIPSVGYTGQPFTGDQRLVLFGVAPLIENAWTEGVYAGGAFIPLK